MSTRVKAVKNVSTTPKSRNIKENGYSNYVRNQKRACMREEAEARQEKRNKLTVEQQLKVIAKRPGESKRETTRLKNFNTNR